MYSIQVCTGVLEGHLLQYHENYNYPSPVDYVFTSQNVFGGALMNGKIHYVFSWAAWKLTVCVCRVRKFSQYFVLLPFFCMYLSGSCLIICTFLVVTYYITNDINPAE